MLICKSREAESAVSIPPSRLCSTERLETMQEMEPNRRGRPLELLMLDICCDALSITMLLLLKRQLSRAHQQ